MAVLGLDFSFARPSLGQIKAAGARWVGRYLSTDSAKNLSRAELMNYLANGLAVVMVWETTANRALAGAAAGAADAHAADAQRTALGMQSNAVIYFAVDTAATWNQVKEYFTGVSSVLGMGRVGVYGDYTVVSAAHTWGLRYLWQTAAWSGGYWHPAASIRQDGTQLLGGAADEDLAEVTDFGQYPRPAAPAPKPTSPTTEADMTPDEFLYARMPAYAAIPGKDGKPYVPTIGECINGARTADTQLVELAAALSALTELVKQLVPAAAAAAYETVPAAAVDIPAALDPAQPEPEPEQGPEETPEEPAAGVGAQGGADPAAEVSGG